MTDLIDCPACEESYPAGGTCECGYCPHTDVADNGTCTACGVKVEPGLYDLVEDLLDAADALVMEIWSTHQTPASMRLRFVVTRLQGLAGARVVTQEGVTC